MRVRKNVYENNGVVAVRASMVVAIGGACTLLVVAGFTVPRIVCEWMVKLYSILG